MTDLNGAQPQPQPMQPVYFGLTGLPYVVEVGVVPGHKAVKVTMHTPAGINFYLLDPDAADKVSDDLRQHASMARTGLIIPGATS